MYKNGQALAILRGNLTADPELKDTETPICEFSLAVNESFKNREGEVVEGVSFLNCVSFGKQAETIAQYLVKGQEVSIVASIRQDRWEDRESGGKRSKIVFRIRNIDFGNKPKAKDGEQEETDEEEVPF